MKDNTLHLQSIRSIDVFKADTSDPKIARLFDNGYVPKLPEPSAIEYGEIAFNIAKDNEVLAIKNYAGDVVFIPFNIANKLFETNQNFEEFKKYTINELRVFSSNTISHFDSIESFLSAYSASTDARFAMVQSEFDSFSGYTNERFNEINERIRSNSESISGLSTQIDDIKTNGISGTTELVHKLSASTESGFSATAITIQELKEAIDALSGLSDSGNTELIYQLSAYTISGFAVNETEHEAILQEIKNQIEAYSGDNLTVITKIKNALGFEKDYSYNPTEENLKDKNVTESIDYIENKVNKQIEESKENNDNLLKIILEDETVTANFAARINYSCGFDIHAVYQPETLEFSGLSVTQAIDKLYKISKEDDSKIDIRIQSIEDWIGDASRQYLEQSITYDRLVELYLLGKLRPGMLYRLTNYQTTVNFSIPNVTTRKAINPTDSNANAGFDILLRATASNTLNENAWAMINPHDTSYSSQHPECWNIKYSLLNDVTRFNWARDDGYGVIYWMKDNHGNEAPYDFKNILFDGKYTFGDTTGADASSTNNFHNNVIKALYGSNGKQQLNKVLFQCSVANGNTIETNCQNILLNGVMEGNTISPSKNGQTISDKANTFIGFNIEN